MQRAVVSSGLTALIQKWFQDSSKNDREFIMTNNFLGPTHPDECSFGLWLSVKCEARPFLLLLSLSVLLSLDSKMLCLVTLSSPFGSIFRARAKLLPNLPPV
jgi:hypothetical protein